MIVYPNINYTLNTKLPLYFNSSLGAYFAFSRTYDWNNWQSGTPRAIMALQGDVIPGGGLSIGYKF
jgi:hypothetical protein